MNRTFGLTMGFAHLIQDDLLAAVRQDGWTHIRNGDDEREPKADAQNVAIVQQIRSAALTPILGEVLADQLETLPLTDLKVEARAFRDTSVGGLEPFFTGDPATEAAELNKHVAVIKAKRLQVYVGMAGTSKSDIAKWTQFLKTLDPVFGVSVHRYPPKRAETWDAPQWRSRAYEIAQLKAVIGTRPWMVGEFGYSQGRFRSLHNYLEFWTHDHLTDEEQAAAIAGEFKHYQDNGADVACLYQFSDGPHYCPTKGHSQYALGGGDGYGIRRVDKYGNHLSWKPSARIPLNGGPIRPLTSAQLGYHAGDIGE